MGVKRGVDQIYWNIQKVQVQFRIVLLHFGKPILFSSNSTPRLSLWRGFTTSLTVFQSCYPSPSVRGTRQTQIPDWPRQLLPRQHGVMVRVLSPRQVQGGRGRTGGTVSPSSRCSMFWDGAFFGFMGRCSVCSVTQPPSWGSGFKSHGGYPGMYC